MASISKEHHAGMCPTGPIPMPREIAQKIEQAAKDNYLTTCKLIAKIINEADLNDDNIGINIDRKELYSYIPPARMAIIEAKAKKLKITRKALLARILDIYINKQ